MFKILLVYLNAEQIEHLVQFLMALKHLVLCVMPLCFCSTRGSVSPEGGGSHPREWECWWTVGSPAPTLLTLLFLLLFMAPGAPDSSVPFCTNDREQRPMISELFYRSWIKLKILCKFLGENFLLWPYSSPALLALSNRVKMLTSVAILRLS